MYRPQRSPAGRSPASGWGFPGHRGASPRGFAASSPGYDPRSERGHWDRSPSAFGSRGFGGQMRRRGDGFRPPQSFSPNFRSSDLSVEKYFNPSMLQDPWAALQPLTSADAAATRLTT